MKNEMKKNILSRVALLTALITVTGAYAHSEHEVSNHILRKLGFEKTSEFEEPDGVCFWYELKREKYKSNDY